MAVFNQPTQWGHELGNNADVSTLPDDTGATTGVASLQKLFQVINQTPLEAGGIAPSRIDFNALFKILGDSIFYMQNGGFWAYNSAFDYDVGRVVLYTDGNLYKCIQANSTLDPKAPTDLDYWLRITTTADSPTGEIKMWTSSTIPNGFLLCNGSAVSRTTYANLFSKIGITFGSGDGSTTFNIPDLRDRYIIGADTNALGTKIAEQLPNICGEVRQYFNTLNRSQTQYYGAFTDSGGYPSFRALETTDNTDIYYNGFVFNAHNSSTIFTDSGKVYPASIALNFIIKT